MEYYQQKYKKTRFSEKEINDIYNGRPTNDGNVGFRIERWSFVNEEVLREERERLKEIER
jgi:hypothetical protein